MKISFVLILATIALASPAKAVTVDLAPARDNTIYQLTPEGREHSNALGTLMFAGSSGIGDLRRALIAFDLSEIPAGSAILSATLTLYNNAPRSNSVPVGLHRLLADWGEGTSDASGTEGRGVPATTGDATWLHRFFPSDPWNNEAGDFIATPSDAQASLTAGYVVFSGAGVAADVQGWIDDPSGNFGWILVGDEVGIGSMKWFSTRENSELSRRPVLSVEYTASVPTRATTWGAIKALYR